MNAAAGDLITACASGPAADQQSGGLSSVNWGREGGLKGRHEMERDPVEASQFEVEEVKE